MGGRTVVTDIAFHIVTGTRSPVLLARDRGSRSCELLFLQPQPSCSCFFLRRYERQRPYPLANRSSLVTFSSFVRSSRPPAHAVEATRTTPAKCCFFFLFFSCCAHTPCVGHDNFRSRRVDDEALSCGYNASIAGGCWCRAVMRTSAELQTNLRTDVSPGSRCFLCGFPRWDEATCRHRIHGAVVACMQLCNGPTVAGKLLVN